MKRVAVVIAGSLLLTGCSSFSVGDYLPSLPSGGGTAALRLESTPPGAEARTSLGQSCRTPCTVAVPGQGDFTVTFALAGYGEQTLPVSLLRSAGIGSDPSGMQLLPNPLIAELEPGAAPPPVAAKKKKAPKPKAAATAKSIAPSSAAPPAARTGQAPADVPAAERTIPGAQPTAPPASAWPPPR